MFKCAFNNTATQQMWHSEASPYPSASSPWKHFYGINSNKIMKIKKNIWHRNGLRTKTAVEYIGTLLFMLFPILSEKVSIFSIIFNIFFFSIRSIQFFDYKFQYIMTIAFAFLFHFTTIKKKFILQSFSFLTFLCHSQWIYIDTSPFIHSATMTVKSFLLNSIWKKKSNKKKYEKFLSLCICKLNKLHM